MASFYENAIPRHWSQQKCTRKAPKQRQETQHNHFIDWIVSHTALRKWTSLPFTSPTSSYPPPPPNNSKKILYTPGYCKYARITVHSGHYMVKKYKNFLIEQITLPPYIHACLVGIPSFPWRRKPIKVEASWVNKQTISPHQRSKL